MLPIPTALLHTVAVPIHPTVENRIFFKAEDGDHQFLERKFNAIYLSYLRKNQPQRGMIGDLY